jgi:hypothetical protein
MGLLGSLAVTIHCLYARVCVRVYLLLLLLLLLLQGGYV